MFILLQAVQVIGVATLIAGAAMGFAWMVTGHDRRWLKEWRRTRRPSERPTVGTAAWFAENLTLPRMLGPIALLCFLIAIH